MYHVIHLYLVCFFGVRCDGKSYMTQEAPKRIDFVLLPMFILPILGRRWRVWMMDL